MYYYQLMRVCLIKYGQQVINQIKVYIEVFRFNNMLLLYFYFWQKNKNGSGFKMGFVVQCIYCGYIVVFFV